MNIVKARLLCIVLLLISVDLYSQEPMPMNPQAAERLEQLKKIRLMEVLRMDEETSLRFFSRYNKHEEEMREFEMKRNRLIDRLQQLRGSDAPDAELQRLTKEIRATGEEAYRTREKYLDEISRLLTAKQFADYIVFERAFLRNLREMMRDVQRERMQRRMR